MQDLQQEYKHNEIWLCFFHNPSIYFYPQRDKQKDLFLHDIFLNNIYLFSQRVSNQSGLSGHPDDKDDVHEIQVKNHDMDYDEVLQGILQQLNVPED